MGPAAALEGLAHGTVRQGDCCVAWAVDCNRAIFAFKLPVVLRYKQFDVRSFQRDGQSCPGFRETRQFLTASRADPLHRVSPTSGHNF